MVRGAVHAAAASPDGAAAELHVVLAEGAHAVELLEHDVAEVWPILAPELAAAERHLSEALRLLHGPVCDGRVEQVGE